MDVTEIRHRNLRFVLECVLPKRGIKRNVDAAQALGGLGSSYLSQLKSGKKMGDDTARKIENALHWPFGRFDSPAWDAATGSVAESAAPYSPTTRMVIEDDREAALIDLFRASDDAGRAIIEAAASAAAAAASKH